MTKNNVCSVLFHFLNDFYLEILYKISSYFTAFTATFSKWCYIEPI